jgi:hypothetical protein
LGRFSKPDWRNSNDIAFDQTSGWFGALLIDPHLARTNNPVNVTFGDPFGPSQQIVIQALTSLFRTDSLKKHCGWSTA